MQQSWLDANNNWISVAGTALGIFLAVAIPWWSRSSVNPGWQMISWMPLLSVGARGSTLKITDSEGREAKSPVLSVIRFGNRGKSDIRGGDYDGAVRISFERSRLIGAAIYDRLGLDTSVELVRDGDTVSFTPALLKKDEWIEVQLMTDGPSEMPRLKARVAGHKAEIMEISEKRHDFWLLTQICSLLTVMVFAFVDLFLRDYGLILGMTIFFVALVILLASSYQKSKSPRWKLEPKLRYRSS